MQICGNVPHTTMTRINGWRRKIWRRVPAAEQRPDRVLCVWEAPDGRELKYRLANPDDDWKYELKTPEGDIVYRSNRRGEVREAATEWLRENGVARHQEA